MRSGEQRRWLAPGFPSLDQPAPEGTVSIGSLLREIDAKLPPSADVRVLVPALFDGADAERPVLQRRVTWTAVHGAAAFAPASPPGATTIALHADLTHRAALPYLRAASEALASGAPSREPVQLRSMNLAGDLRGDETHLAWLSAAPLPSTIAAWVQDGGVVLLAHEGNAGVADWGKATPAWRRDDGVPLARRVSHGKGAWVQMLVPFDARSLPFLLEPAFPRMLQELLAASPETATRTTSQGYAPVVGAQAAYPQDPRPIGHWLGWLIAFVFGMERWMAASPRRQRP